ncbi:uncharacterized protein N0V89_007113 [Didymosphaeria variabile]|uniref:Uncharacterized protein n=1 Tax=Didymosphaeria variabile TaxID=1932322 RepID=A0A9W8XKV2_9PLEO|nr:uncharacterized protein N0V89_007113 [Didymosphaeria variabile]KAJ4351770.1 hypothetical protein N0V89_007113 [Didymosphaeria variabile]
MSRSLFYAALNHDFSEAILGGCQSTFDSTGWLDSPPPENPEREREDFTCISTEIARHMIQLPRLVALVRQVRSDPFHADASIEALSLAEHLYCRYSDIIASRIDAVLITGAASVDTLDEELARYCPKSLEFEWFNIFEGVVRCYYVRILVLHLCATLRTTFPFSPILNAADLEEEEAQCAALIAASVQYAEKQEPFLLGALIMRLPLQVAYGTWWRRMTHDSMEQDQVWEGEKATFMEEWCAQKTNAFIEVLNGDHVSKHKLRAMYVAAAEGGPWEICKQKGPLV